MRDSYISKDAIVCYCLKRKQKGSGLNDYELSTKNKQKSIQWMHNKQNNKHSMNDTGTNKQIECLCSYTVYL